VRLSDRLGGRVIVLYFLPKDGTPGCTAETRASRASRDSHEVFAGAGTLDAP
jgi:peroxiredoxin Q/BCP